jgi:hypothetical protein
MPLFDAQPRKIRDEAEARALLDELDHARVPLVDLCRARGLDARSLACWRRNLQRRAPEPLRFVELVTTPAPPPAARYRLTVGDVAIELSDDFHPHTLARILAAVRGC